MTTVAITQISDFDAAFGHLGTRVGPRIGPDKRTQDAKEWFVLRHFMASALPAAVFDLPIEISKVHPPEPDFAVVHGFTRSTALIEITEATHPDDQREMTEFAKGGMAHIENKSHHFNSLSHQREHALYHHFVSIQLCFSCTARSPGALTSGRSETIFRQERGTTEHIKLFQKNTGCSAFPTHSEAYRISQIELRLG